jgi:hypothetical protein
VTVSGVFESPLFQVFERLKAEGFEFRLVAGARVQVRPIGRLPADVRALFRQHPDEFRLFVSNATDAGVHKRRDEFHRQLEAATPPAVPAFLFKGGIPYVQGTCFSCGDALPEARFGRCWRCSLAWRLACRLPIPADLAAAMDTAKVSA